MKPTLKIYKLIYYPQDNNFFDGAVSFNDGVRYLKCIFTDITSFNERYIKIIDDSITDSETRKEFGVDVLINKLLETYPIVEPYTHREAIEINYEPFKELVLNIFKIPENNPLIW